MNRGHRQRVTSSPYLLRVPQWPDELADLAARERLTPSQEQVLDTAMAQMRQTIRREREDWENRLERAVLGLQRSA